MTPLPPPIEGREAAARRWELLLKVTALVMAVSGIIAALEYFIDFPWRLVAAAGLGLLLGLVAVVVSGIAVGWTRGVAWYNAFVIAFRMARAAICTFF